MLDKCPLEELHSMSGFVNHTFFNSLVKVIVLERALNFPKSLSLVAKNTMAQYLKEMLAGQC